MEKFQKISKNRRRNNHFKPHHKVFFISLIVGLMSILLIILISSDLWSGTNTPRFVLDMNVSGTTVIDAVNGSTNGTYAGTLAQVDGKLGRALRSDNIDSINVSFAISNSTDFSIQFWMNISDSITSTALFGNSFPGAATASNDGIYIRVNDGFLDWGFVNDGSASAITSTYYVNQSSWQHIVLTYAVGDPTGTGKIYINSTLNKNQAKQLSGNKNSNLSIFGTPGNEDITYSVNNTMLDEFIWWNRVLSGSEVTELWNGGAGTPFLPQTAASILNSPSNNENKLTSQNVTFNCTGRNLGTNIIQNISLYHNESGNFILNKTKDVSGASSTDISAVFGSTFETGSYNWNCRVCITGLCTFNEINNTLNIAPVIKIKESFNDTVVETSTPLFEIQVNTSSGFTVQQADLHYNGTIFSNIDKLDVSGGLKNLSITITIPQGSQGFGSEIREFFYNITIANVSTGVTSSFSIALSNQTVNELTFGLCNGENSIPMINFTMKDEITGVEINGANNATTFQATFLLGLNPDNLIKNFSINNVSVTTNKFNFCTNVSTNIFIADMELFYTAQAYNDKKYFLDGATLSNSTSLVDLFLLRDTVGVEFFIDVEKDLTPLTEAVINIQKFFVGEGVFKTVEIDTTDGDGKITTFLDLNKDYRFAITKDGDLLAILDKRAICEAAPCTLSLSITSDPTDFFAGFSETFAGDVLYNLTFNPSTDIVTFQFIDITGLATSFRMDITRVVSNGTSEIISSQTLFTSSGSMTFNASSLENGEFRADTFISRSPKTFIDFITFVINSISAQLGTLGLFMAFFTILFIIFGLSFTPRILVFSVPLALLSAKLMAIISLSGTVITVLFILAGIAVAFMDS